MHSASSLGEVPAVVEHQASLSSSRNGPPMLASMLTVAEASIKASIGGLWVLVPGFWFLFLVPGSWVLVPGFLVSGFFLAPGSWFRVPGFWFLVSGSWFLLPRFW